MAALGRPVPEGFANRPELTPTEAFYWAAFRDLGTDRQMGMGLGPIPWSSARVYAEVHGIVNPDEFDNFWTIIHAVDTDYLKSANETAKKSAGDRKQVETSDGPLSRSRQNNKAKTKNS